MFFQDKNILHANFIAAFVCKILAQNVQKCTSVLSWLLLRIISSQILFIFLKQSSMTNTYKFLMNSIFQQLVAYIHTYKFFIYMSNNKKNSSSSILGKVFIGVAGIIGGLLIGKAIDQFSKPETTESVQSQNNKMKVDPTEYTKNIEDYDNIEELMTCPITNCIMKKPVIITECGHTFQKQQIHKWVQSKKHCPLCQVSTNISSLKPNYQLQQIISEYLKKKKEQREAQEKKQKTEKTEKNEKNEKNENQLKVEEGQLQEKSQK